ncbi:N-acyl-D-amino-acid deacylase family protein [Sandarakinorhabdus rubra]|uniref:N-acyl-D-amino-acid deacylase family protein n=1 Tax=Sandarakinorhabdus rubra TaxID=2672568 RepID=UPI0013DB7B43|nr:amidohydrolase family protein [Sandarakinorhabdus rubra]
MSDVFDLVIRQGTIIDGSGGAAFEADVAVKDGRIAAVGPDLARGAEEMEARGLLVTPGLVDIHTHYDGQATWESRLQPSTLHGVTTVVSGNCGVGFAPCRPADHDRLIRLMEGVEDLPFPVLKAGLPWTWESFGEYLASLEPRAFDADIGLMLPHAALRVFVMGERGANREPATAEDIAQMAAIAEAAMHAGAIGFSTSRTLNHRTSDGQPTPTLTAAEDELMGIALALGRAGKGVLQFVSDFADPDAEFGLMRRLCEASGRPLSFSLAQSPVAPRGWRRLLDLLEQATADGLPMKAQVAARPVGVLLGLDLTLNPFSLHPDWPKAASVADQARLLADPAFVARLIANPPPKGNALGTALLHRWGDMYQLGDPPNYEPLPETSLAAQAMRRGVPYEVVAAEWLCANDGAGMIYVPFLNYADGDLDAVHAMLTHPDTVPGLSDGGAHVGMICDGSFPTTLLTHWVRDRVGARLQIEQVIRRQARDTALAVGLADRGLIAPGFRADLNLIDAARLRLMPPTVRHDLPAGGRRLMQAAAGIRATIVAGAVTYRDGEATGALPGRLLRGARPA